MYALILNWDLSQKPKEIFEQSLCANISETFSPCQIEVGRVGDL
jgi:hypothetical protein